MDPNKKEYKILMVLFGTCVASTVAFFVCFILSIFGSSDSIVYTSSSISSWNENETGTYLSAVSVKVKVMPSQGHGVQEFMNWTNYEYTPNNSTTPYSPSYHLYSKNTAMIFATFIFSDEMVPVGDSQEKCVYLEIAPNSEKMNPAAFKPLEGLPDCKRSKNGWWNFHDPVIGINVPTWYQQELTLTCSGKACIDTCAKKNGWWVYKADNVTGICYKYTVLTQICATVSKFSDSFGKVHWKYAGGCFKDSNPGFYQEAKPGTTYRFEAVPIMVRASDDPYLSSTQTSDSTSVKGNNSLKIVSLLLFLVALVSGIGGGLFYKHVKDSGNAHRPLD